MRGPKAGLPLSLLPFPDPARTTWLGHLFRVLLE